MLPQHGGVPNFSLRIPGPILLLLGLVLITGSLLTLSFFLNANEGDLAAQSRTKLSLIITLLLSFFILLSGTSRWWYPHLWKHGNSQKQHRQRRRGHSSGRHHRR
ncbi:MAG: hypothetical protein IT583_00900 [Verrucomicrobia bacterium]|nr:hypothetical protein [Verrucomicrobiota bacterium]